MIVLEHVQVLIASVADLKRYDADPDCLFTL